MKAYLLREGQREARQCEKAAVEALITRIAAVSGNPRGACWRFARRLGLKSKPSSRPWTRPEQQRLLELIASHSLVEVTLLMRRSSGSVRSMLHRLGANARMGQDWFTKHTLAEALHIRAEEVQKWIDRGWLKCRVVGTDGLRRQLIDADDFCEFCRQHRKEIVGKGLTSTGSILSRLLYFLPATPSCCRLEAQGKSTRLTRNKSRKRKNGKILMN